MDSHKISVNRAWEIAQKPAAEQRKIIVRPSKAKAIEESKRTGQTVLADDGNYYKWEPPEVERAATNWQNVIYHIDQINKLLEVDDLFEIIPEIVEFVQAQYDPRIEGAAAWMEEFAEKWRDYRDTYRKDKAAWARKNGDLGASRAP